MKNYLINRSLLFSTLAPLLTAFIFGLSGCQTPSVPLPPPLNLDSVKTHILPIKDAIRYTATFRSNMDSCIKKYPHIKDSMRFGTAEAFNSDAIGILLSQKDSTGTAAAGVRIYYGLDETGSIKLVLVPYDKNGNDIINRLLPPDDKQVPGVSSPKAEALTSSGSPGQTIELGQQCPTICDNGNSGLNGTIGGN